MVAKLKNINFETAIDKAKRISQRVKIVRLLDTKHLYRPVMKVPGVERFESDNPTYKHLQDADISEKGTKNVKIENNEIKILPNTDIYNNFIENLSELSEVLNFSAYELSKGEGFILQIGENLFVKVEKDDKESKSSISTRYEIIDEELKGQKVQDEQIEKIINNGQFDYILEGQIIQYNKRENRGIKLPKDYKEKRNDYIKEYKYNGKTYLGVKVEGEKDEILYFEIIKKTGKLNVEVKTTLDSEEIKTDGNKKPIKINAKEKIQDIKAQGFNLNEQLKEKLKSSKIILDLPIIDEQENRKLSIFAPLQEYLERQGCHSVLIQSLEPWATTLRQQSSAALSSSEKHTS